MELNTFRALTKGQAQAECQNCFQTGHWTYQCRNEKVYLTRPSRTQMLRNPKLRAPTFDDDDVPEIPL
ncbi:zinc knuckle protein, partial [Toxoplasma gondii RUB]